MPNGLPVAESTNLGHAVDVGSKQRGSEPAEHAAKEAQKDPKSERMKPQEELKSLKEQRLQIAALTEVGKLVPTAGREVFKIFAGNKDLQDFKHKIGIYKKIK